MGKEGAADAQALACALELELGFVLVAGESLCRDDSIALPMKPPISPAMMAMSRPRRSRRGHRSRERSTLR